MQPEKFISHPVFEKLEQLKQTLEKNDSIEKIPVNDLHFFTTVKNYIKNRLALTLPILVQEGELNNISSEMDGATVQINSFLGNKNPGHLSNATNNFNSVINRVKNLPFPLSKSDFDFSSAIVSFEQNIQEAYSRLRTANENLSNDLALVTTQLEERKKQLVALEQEIVAKKTEINNVLIKYNTDFESLKTNANTDINAEKKKFNENIEADRKLYKEEFESVKESMRKIFEDQKRKLDTQSTEIISTLNAKLDEAKKIVNIVGNIGVTGNYQNIANQNKKSADFFRLVALGFMSLMSIILICSIIEISRNGEFNLYKSLLRVLAAAVLTYPAVYAAKESAKHRKLETKNRNLELELASIGPFIELLPQENKNKIKQELANKYFGNNNSIEDTKENNEDVSVNVIERILKALLPVLKIK
jgi:hypothetical protein